MIAFLQMRQQLNSNALGVCLFGNDQWVKRKAVANLCDTMGVTDDGFSVDRLETPTLADIKMACLTPSMFCPKKVVVVSGFSIDGATQADAKRQIAQLLEENDGSFCLVFVTDAEKPFGDIPGMQTVNCNKLDKPNVVKWIVQFAKRQGCPIDNLCADKLATYCLCDMARVSVETQKLIDHGDVTLDAVEQLVHKDAEYAVYDLSGVIADKNANKALQMYKGLVARGEEPRALFGLLYNFYRRAYYVKTSAFTAEETASFLGVKPGAINFAGQTAKRYKAMQLKRALDCFDLADRRLKAFVDENEVLTLLIMQLVAL